MQFVLIIPAIVCLLGLLLILANFATLIAQWRGKNTSFVPPIGAFLWCVGIYAARLIRAEFSGSLNISAYWYAVALLDIGAIGRDEAGDVAVVRAAGAQRQDGGQCSGRTQDAQ